MVKRNIRKDVLVLILMLLASLYMTEFAQGRGWLLGWLGVPDPFPLHWNCDGPVTGPGSDTCPNFYATQTAQAPHPPAWLPWGRPTAAATP